MKRLLSLIVVGLLLTSRSAFALLAEGKTGPASWSGNNSQIELRLSPDGGVFTQDQHARFTQAVRNGNAFYCANPAGTSVTTQAGLSATTPALTLYNPVNSGRNLVIMEISVAPTAAPAAAAEFMVALSSAGGGGGPSATTAGTMQNALTGSLNQSTGQCYRVATLIGTPTAIRYLGGTTGAAAISGVQLIDQTEGKIVMSPGTAISIQATSAAAIISHILFEEVPL